MRRLAASAILLAALTVGATGCMAFGYRTKPRIAIVGGDPLVQMAPAAKFRSAVDPHKVLAAHHRDAPAGRERVVGLEVDGQAFAYPIGLLDRVEVVNDGNGAVHWVVARCALTHVAAVYDRTLQGRLLTFENSGALWRDTLVLRDRETGTYWTAATGAALSGPLAGRRLQPRPAVYTNAAAWRRSFPDSRYAELGISTSVPLMMRVYGASPWQGISGVKTTDRRHRPKEEFLSVAAGRETLAFRTSEIRRRGVVESSVGGEELRVEWDSRLETARAWARGDSARERARRELAVVPMYWFALDRHFDEVKTLD